MINRIRDIRKQKGMTLAEVAAACAPPTTAQTIGRLETGMRNLSLGWMNKIAAALGVDPELLVKGEAADQPMVVARLTVSGAEPLPSRAMRSCRSSSAEKRRSSASRSTRRKANTGPATSSGCASSRPTRRPS